MCLSRSELKKFVFQPGSLLIFQASSCRRASRRAMVFSGFFQVLAIFLLLLLFQLVLLANRKSACFHGFDFVMLTNTAWARFITSSKRVSRKNVEKKRVLLLLQ